MSLLYAGFGATIGHDFPFWMKFRGGKGVASSSVAFVIFVPFWGLIASIAGMFIVFATKYLCIGGVVIPVFLGIIYALFFNNIEALIILIIFAVLAFTCHFTKIAGIPSGKTEKTDVIGALRRKLSPGKLFLIILAAIVIVASDMGHIPASEMKDSAPQCFTGALLRMLRHGRSQPCKQKGASHGSAARQERRVVPDHKKVLRSHPWNFFFQALSSFSFPIAMSHASNSGIRCPLPAYSSRTFLLSSRLEISA